MLRVRADAPLTWRLPRFEGCRELLVFAAALNPPALAHCLFLVWGVAYDDVDRLFSLDLIRVLARVADRCCEAGYPLLVIVGVSESVRHKHTQWSLEWSTGEINNFREYPELRHGKG